MPSEKLITEKKKLLDEKALEVVRAGFKAGKKEEDLIAMGTIDPKYIEIVKQELISEKNKAAAEEVNKSKKEEVEESWEEFQDRISKDNNLSYDEKIKKLHLEHDRRNKTEDVESKERDQDIIESNNKKQIDILRKSIDKKLTEKLNDAKEKLADKSLSFKDRVKLEVEQLMAEYNLYNDLSDDFKNLSDDKKYYVIQNLKKRVVDVVKSDVETQYSEYLKNKMSDVASQDGRLNKILTGIKNVGKGIWEGVKKESELKDIETQVFKQLKTTPQGKELILKDLSSLTKIAEKQRLVYDPEEGFINIHITPNEIANCTPEEAKAIHIFNTKAYKFKEMPYEWGQENKSIIGGNKRKYEKAKQEYEKAKQEILIIKSKRIEGPDKGQALVDIKNIDSNIKMDQLLNTHPEFEKVFDDYNEPKKWLGIVGRSVGNFFQTITGGKGKYGGTANKLLFLSGFIIRGGAKVLSKTSKFAGPIGLASAPIFGAAFGGLRGRLRAKETLQKRKENARYGQADKSKESMNFVNAIDLSKRLEIFLNKLSDIQNNPDAINTYVKVGDLMEIEGRTMKVEGILPDGKVSFVEIKSHEWETGLHPNYPNNESYEVQKQWLIDNEPRFSGKEISDITFSDVDNFEKERNQSKFRKDIQNEESIEIVDLNKDEVLGLVEENLLDQINRRITYTQNKIEQGLVNFGDKRESLGNQFNLLNNLNEAVINSVSAEKGIRADIDARLNRFLFKKSKKIESRQKEFIKKQMKEGAMIGAGAATFGYITRWAGEQLGWWGGGHNVEKKLDNLKGVEALAGQPKFENLPNVNNSPIIDTEVTKPAITTDTLRQQIDSTIQSKPELQDTIPEAKTIPSVKVDEAVKTNITPKVEKIVTVPKAPNIIDEKIINTPKAPVIEDTLKTPSGSSINNPSVINKPEIIDESTIKTEGVDFQEGVNTENVVLNTNEIPTPINNESIDLSGAHQVTGAPNIVDKMETIPKVPNVDENNIDLSGARKISGPEIVTEKVDEYGLGTVTKTETPILMDDNIRPTQPGGFNNESIGSGRVIKPTEAVDGYNTGEEKGNIYPRSGALKGGPNPASISREVPMTDREAIFTNKGNKVFENGVNNNVNENLPIESDPRHFETAREIRQTFGRQTVLIDKAEYPTLDQVEDGVNYNDWNTANDTMFEQKGLDFNSYEEFNKERELQELFGTTKYTENPAKVVYDQVSGKNVLVPENISITQEYFRDMPTWKIIDKIPAKYFMQEDFLNGNNLSQENLNALVNKGIITQNPLTGTYSFSHRNEVERLSLFYKKLVGSKDYEKFIDKVEHTLGNDKPIGNENMETYIKRITEKVYKADDNTLFGFKRPVDWDDRDSWSRDYNGGRPSQDRMMRPISPTRRIYER